MNALVFGGGGGKGAYEIGVWKALRELNMERLFSCVIGTSVGALNAVLFAQKSFDKAEEIWSALSPGLVLPDNFGRGSALASQEGLRRILLQYVHLTPLDLSVYVCCSRITSGASDYINFLGVDLAERYQPEYFRLNTLSRWKQIQCLLASAAMPFAFDKVEIDGAWYRDGGISPKDNLPYEKAAALGFSKILSVSLEVGVTREISCGKANVMIICPSASLGNTLDGILDFEAENAGWRSRLGYMDTISRKNQIRSFFDTAGYENISILTESQKERLNRIFKP